MPTVCVFLCCISAPQGAPGANRVAPEVLAAQVARQGLRQGTAGGGPHSGSDAVQQLAGRGISPGAVGAAHAGRGGQLHDAVGGWRVCPGCPSCAAGRVANVSLHGCHFSRCTLHTMTELHASIRLAHLGRSPLTARLPRSMLSSPQHVPGRVRLPPSRWLRHAAARGAGPCAAAAVRPGAGPQRGAGAGGQAAAARTGVGDHAGGGERARRRVRRAKSRHRLLMCGCPRTKLTHTHR